MKWKLEKKWKTNINEFKSNFKNLKYWKPFLISSIHMKILYYFIIEH